jgi:RND family efflux transporter MFP subunit
MRHDLDAPPGKMAPQILCYKSPQDPSFMSDKPGKDPQGNELVPVYAEAPSSSPASRTKGERKIKYWVSPMDPGYVRDQPGKAPCGMDLVPVYEDAPVATAAAPKGERKIKYWVSPMDPGYVRDQPGKAPCGMDLVPVYEDDTAAKAEGVITVAPGFLQSMGVRTATAQVKTLSRTIRAVGLVAYNERLLNTITTKVTGYVERLYHRVTGEPIRKGQPLLSIYSPELVSAQKEYLLALKGQEELRKSPFPELRESANRMLAASRQRLEYWDISSAQIEELERTRQVQKYLTLSSPVNGIIIKRSITQGMMVQPGMPLLEVVDLSTVWVEAEVYEYELPWIRPGQHALVTLTYLPGQTFHGTVEYIYPYLKGSTRTVRVRIKIPNPKLQLKPEMFAQAEIVAPLGKPTVAIPTEAVLNTGEKQYVFLSLGQGRFEPRAVKLGVDNGDGWVEILSGLKGGQEVVTSAQFLLDSESRFREAIANMLQPAAPAPGGPAAPAIQPTTPAPAMPPMQHKH